MMWLGLAGHTCNPSYVADRGRKIVVGGWLLSKRVRTYPKITKAKRLKWESACLVSMKPEGRNAIKGIYD
jgi:hypothetical protein